MDCRTPGFPVHHQLPELAQTHVHLVGDANQPSHPPSSSPPPGFNLSKHQGLSQWVSSLNQVAKSIGALASASILPMNIQDWFSLGLTGLIFLPSKGLSSLLQHHSSKASFFGTQLSLWFNSHIHTWLLEKPLLLCFRFTGKLSAKCRDFSCVKCSHSCMISPFLNIPNQSGTLVATDHLPTLRHHYHSKPLVSGSFLLLLFWMWTNV